MRHAVTYLDEISAQRKSLKPLQPSGLFMRIKVHCQNRIGILRDILNLLVEYGINVCAARSAVSMATPSTCTART
jgi:transcriptional regulator of aroF, aroG, tyrA and aromatic amino acid transport